MPPRPQSQYSRFTSGLGVLALNIEIEAGHIWHVCQWGFWGSDSTETCEEADHSMDFTDEHGLSVSGDAVHEHCGWFHFQRSKIVQELEGLFDGA